MCPWQHICNAACFRIELFKQHNVFCLGGTSLRFYPEYNLAVNSTIQVSKKLLNIDASSQQNFKVTQP